MKYLVDPWNNFCRVFELPDPLPTDYCFGEGIPCTMKMVDWFHPIPDMPTPAVTREVWEASRSVPTVEVQMEYVEPTLRNFILAKNYVKPGRTYLVLYEFGAASVFSNT